MGLSEEFFREVDNPWTQRSDKQLVKVNIRETPIEHMHAHGQISNDEKYAADAFRRHSERTRIGAKVSDPSRPPAQGGISDPLEEIRLNSLRALQRARSLLGEIDYWLLWQSVGVGNSMRDIVGQLYRRAKDSAARSQKEAALHVGRRIKDALALLVAHGWCMPPTSKSHPAPSSRFYRSFGTLSTDIVPDE